MSDTATQNDEPSWLDSSYLKKILNKYTDNQLSEIKSFHKAPATVKGENYASAMHLINAEYTTTTTANTTASTTASTTTNTNTNTPTDEVQNVTLIIKSRLENELMSQIEEDFNVFHREAQVYTVIMDEAEKLLRSIGDETIFGPRAIYVDERIIVQENLKTKGYAIEDVKKGLNYEQCRLVLAKLAKFHAASMVLYKKNPDVFRHHLPGNVSEHPSPLHDLYTNAIRACIDYCRTNPKLEKYVEKLQGFGDTIIPKMINVFSRNQNDRFHVLNHGDMWVNNMMFRQGSDKTPVDVLFVDYQEGFYGSPGIDWNYFIFSSWQRDVFENHFEELLQLYLATLSDVLHKLNYVQRIPTVEDVKKEIINKGFHGLTTATCLLPILINEHEDLTDPINFLLETDEAVRNRKTIFNNPKFGERLELFLSFFVDNGVL